MLKQPKGSSSEEEDKTKPSKSNSSSEWSFIEASKKLLEKKSNKSPTIFSDNKSDCEGKEDNMIEAEPNLEDVLRGFKK